MGFEVGRQVVCVWDNWNTGHCEALVRTPVKGETYTIRSVMTEEFSHPTYIAAFGPNNFSIRLVELHNDLVEDNIHGGTIEPAFVVVRPDGEYSFRLIQKTDISVLTALLNKTPKLEDV